jgi:hypothetical protein
MLRIAAVAVALLTASPAFADLKPPTKGGGMDNTISAFGLLSYWYAESGFGLGARYQRTVHKEGVLKLPTVKDDFGIEGGIDFVHYSFGFGPVTWTLNEYAIVVGGVWNFWLSDQLALYPKVDLGYRIVSWSTNTGFSNPTGYGGIILQGAAGVCYKLDRLTLRAEAGSGTLRLGVGFTL